MNGFMPVNTCLLLNVKIVVFGSLTGLENTSLQEMTNGKGTCQNYQSFLKTYQKDVFKSMLSI